MRNGAIVGAGFEGVDNRAWFFAQVVDVAGGGVRDFPRGVESCLISNSSVSAVLLPLTLTLSPPAGRGDLPHAQVESDRDGAAYPFSPPAGRRCR
ncbi:hypothetical protein CYG48_04550 [Neorhizobium sp. SOG26]|nr:hypothetical protein CYG48_04550 [Neorhizobium sp. SOG26]